MVNAAKLRVIRGKPMNRQRTRVITIEKSPDWENIFDFDLKREIGIDAQRGGLKTWDRVQSQGQYRDFTLKFLESRPKVKSGIMGRITREGARVSNHSMVKKSEKHRQFAVEETARVLDKQLHQGKNELWYVKGRRGALKTEAALSLKADLAEILE